MDKIDKYINAKLNSDKLGICECDGKCVANETDVRFMEMAIKEAEKAMTGGDVPIGCVIVDDVTGAVVSKAFNKKERSLDATAHAEMLCIRKACKVRGDWRLENCSLYVTLEPCPMCFGAILSARISRVVFGARDLNAGFLGGFCDYSKHNMLNHNVEVMADVLGDKCQLILRDFFKRRRMENKAKKLNIYLK